MCWTSGEVKLLKKGFPASIDSLEDMQQFVREMIQIAQFDPSNAIKIEVAIEEALVNVITHAYVGKKDSEKTLEVSCYLQPEGIEFVIVDRGVVFNPVQYVQERCQTLSAEEQCLGGYGLLLITQMMDNVRYLRDGEQNVLTIAKYK